MYTKRNTRVTFRSNKRPNFKRSNNFSNNKPRNKGNVTQQYNKYLKLAKEAYSSSDRVQSEYYYQFTDHYYRLMLELGITLEENENQDERLSEIQSNNTEDVDSEGNILIDKKETIKDENENSLTDDTETLDESDSIESIPFISKPPKKKSTRVKKSSV